MPIWTVKMLLTFSAYVGVDADSQEQARHKAMSDAAIDDGVGPGPLVKREVVSLEREDGYVPLGVI